MIGQEDDRWTTHYKCMQVLLVKTSACTQQEVLQDPHGKVTQEQGISNARKNGIILCFNLSSTQHLIPSPPLYF